MTEDETAPDRIVLSLSHPSVDEAAAGVRITVTATLATASPGTAGTLGTATTVTVAVGATGDSATEGTDYDTVADVTITIAAGALSGTATFDIVPSNDNAAEGDESISVSGTTTAPGLTVVAPAPLRIVDDDVSATITATSPTSLTEAALRGDTVTVTVDLAGGVTFVTGQTLQDALSLVLDPAGGIEIAAVARLSATQVRLTLEIAAGGDIDADTDLAVRVAASGHSGSTALTTGTVRVTQIPAPAQVAGVTVTPGDGQLAVTWNAATDADGYKVQWKSGSESYHSSRQATLAASARSHDIPNLTNGTTYTVRVIATRANAPDGAPSDEATGTPLGLPGAPSVTGRDGAGEEGGRQELRPGPGVVDRADRHRRSGAELLPPPIR